MRHFLLVALAVAVVCTLATASDVQAESSTKSPVTVKPPVAAIQKPMPPENARKATSVGAGRTEARSSNSAGDTDWAWVQEIDIDGDGSTEEVDALWDDEDKVLFLSKDLDLDCALTDGTADASLLVALYGKDNTASRPAGSGWYAVDLDEGECAAAAEDLYGCRFDASGQPTACGTATIDYDTDEIDIAEVSD